MNQEQETQQDYLMHLSSERLKSFKNNWPFDKSCKCTASKLAEAGFYLCATENEPDAVRCFMCLKELDGWEPDDDPWEEHKSHSPKCQFLSLGKLVEDLTVEEFAKLEMNRQKNKFNKMADKMRDEFIYIAKETRLVMENLAK